MSENANNIIKYITDMSEISVIDNLEAEYAATKLFKNRLQIQYSLPPVFSDRFESCFADIGPHVIFGTFTGDELQGASLVKQKHDLHDRPVADISYLAVETEYERQGIGFGLLEYCIEFAKNTGMYAIELTARLESASFYDGRLPIARRSPQLRRLVFDQ